MSNYPDGVTDAHEHFNPKERYLTVNCTTEEALVVPSFMVKGELQIILDIAATGNKAGTEAAIHALLAEIQDFEREGGYECQWEGEMELPVSEDAEWDCPRCGVSQTSDTIPDDGPDPDEAYERMKEARYDD